MSNGRIATRVAWIGVLGVVLGVGVYLWSRQQEKLPAAETSAEAAVTWPNYLAAKFDPIHFRPAIDTATNDQCLRCHAEVTRPSVRERSPGGLAAKDTLAWYQRTSTYAGDQDTFHRRHLDSEFARRVMKLQCNTCHQGHDPRDENPNSSATATRDGRYRLRKVVIPETTCLKCHGQMNYQVMGLPSPWHESRALFQDNCMTCHASIRTVRHQVNYLDAAAIESAGAKSGDVCYGCHGGRAWYRLAYPYPRHAWEGMPSDVPDWARHRPVQSEDRFLLKTAAPRAGNP